jgi:hypothetical protein
MYQRLGGREITNTLGEGSQGTMAYSSAVHNLSIDKTISYLIDATKCKNIVIPYLVKF